MEREPLGKWIEVRVAASREAVEAVAEVLSRYGHQRGVVIEEARRPAQDGISLEPDPSRPAILYTYLPAQEAAEVLPRMQATLDLLGELSPVGPLQVRRLEERDWANAWREHFTTLQVSERFLVVPSWKEAEVAPGQIVLHLDPGMAFGTGLHPTTRLCLRALEKHLRPGMRVLDLGTGSGILAIAAARLGSGPVLALDVDPLAVRTARENARRNRVQEQVVVEQGTLQPRAGPFDLILANLLAPTLQDLAALLASSLTERGILIASGVLEHQSEQISRSLEAQGLYLRETLSEEVWVALVSQR